MFKRYRKLRNYTQEQLADLTGLDPRTIQRIENYYKIPTMESFKKLVKILKIEDKDILDYIKKRR